MLFSVASKGLLAQRVACLTLCSSCAQLDLALHFLINLIRALILVAAVDQVGRQ